MADDKLGLYRQQLAQVEAAIEQDPENPEWTKLRNDLLEVIELTSELAQVKATTSAVNDEELKTYSVGEKCQAIYELDGQWYNAKIVALAEDGYFVSYMGYGNTGQVEFNEVRLYQRPDTSGWSKETEVTAVAAVDGRWYDAAVVEVKEGTVVVRFKGDSETAEVEVDFVRVKASTVEKKRKQPEEEKVEVDPNKEVLPKSLEILPDDSEDAIEKKKKKLKMFKRQEKKDKEEKMGEGRRSTWKDFSKKSKTIHKSKNFHDPHWDPTRDHGELAARQQMEKYSTYLVREGA